MKPSVNSLLLAPLFLYFFAIPFSMAGMETFGWISFLVAVGWFVADRVKTGKWPSLRLGPDAFLWAFWGILILGAIFIDELPSKERTYIIGEGRWILLLYALTYLLKKIDLERVRRILPLLYGMYAFVGIYSVGQFFFGYFVGTGKSAQISNFGAVSGWRPPGFYSSSMTFSYGMGMWLLVMLALFLVGFKGDRLKMKKLAGAVFLVLGLALILTFTRGAWLSLTVAGLIMIWLYNKKLAKRVALSALVFIPLVVIAVPAIRHRVTNVMDASNSNRIKMWQGNWGMFLDHPLMGVGYRQNSRRMPEYKEKLNIDTEYVGHAHNTYLQTLAGTGLPGLIVYLGFSIGLLVLAWRLWKLSGGHGLIAAIALGSLGAQIHLHVGGLTECNFQDGEVNHSFLFLTALMLAAYSKTKATTQMRSKEPI